MTQLQRADAVGFIRAQGIRGTRAEIEAACAPYGYRPLSLCLLAGLIAGDLQQPGDIAAAKRLDVSGDPVRRQHHLLERAYDSLTLARRALLSRIACFRSPVAYATLKALAETAEKSSTMLDADLRDLVSRGLLHHDTKEGRFDLHPIVRRYAYDRLTVPERITAHTQLRDYFGAVPKPHKVACLEDLAPVIELYHHTVRAGQFDKAVTLFRDRLCPDPLFHQFGAYYLIVDLLHAVFPDGEDRPPRLKDQGWQAWTLNQLANSYSCSGQPRRAVPLSQQHNAIQEKLGNKSNLASGLENLAVEQLAIGALRVAEVDLRRAMVVSRGNKDKFAEAVEHQELARLLAYRGAHAESETELTTAMKMLEKQKDVQAQGVNWAYRALCELLMLRSAPRTPDSVLDSARRALELADDTTRTVFPCAGDYVRGHWLLGAAHRIAGHYDEAERHLYEALERCRRINLVEFEADILIDLARLRAATGSSEEAQRLAEEAVLITERCGYVLQGADAHLELAKLAFSRGDKTVGLELARKAKELATCDGPPDYTYKAAYDEACALLRGQ